MFFLEHFVFYAFITFISLHKVSTKKLRNCVLLGYVLLCVSALFPDRKTRFDRKYARARVCVSEMENWYA